MGYIFVAILFIISCCSLLLKLDKAEMAEDFKIHPRLIQLLYLVGLNSFVIAWILNISWLYWFSLFSVICIQFISIEKLKKKVITVFLVLGLIAISRVPTDPDSFREYMNTKESYQCLQYFECVKMESVVDEEGHLQTVVEILPVGSDSYNWYFFFGKGHFTIGEEEFRGINIAGFWIEYKSLRK